MAEQFDRGTEGSTVPFELRPYAEQYFRLSGGSFRPCDDDFWIRYPKSVCILYVVQMSGDLLSVDEFIIPQCNCRPSNLNGKYKAAIERMKKRHRKNLLLRLMVNDHNED